MAKFSTNSELLGVPSCSPLSPSNIRISIIQQSYCLAIASTELYELVSSEIANNRRKLSYLSLLTMRVDNRLGCVKYFDKFVSVCQRRLSSSSLSPQTEHLIGATLNKGKR